MVLDTETINVNNRTIYNIGGVIYNPHTQERLLKFDYLIIQVWENKKLFKTAYFYNKKYLYKYKLEKQKIKLIHMGYAFQNIKKMLKRYNVGGVYCYNSPFDQKAIIDTCKNYNVINTLQDLPFYDIMGYVMNITDTKEFKDFCKVNNYLTATQKGYSQTAEIVYRFIKKDTSFVESHTALHDSEIELEILLECINRGRKWETHYQKKRLPI